MSLPLHEQFTAALARARRPLILMKEAATLDDFAAAFGIASLIKKMEKAVDIVTANSPVPDSLRHLSVAQPVAHDLAQIRSLTLRIDSVHAKVDELSYTTTDDALLIHITPKTGAWTASDVTIEPSAYRHDLVIIVGAQDLRSLGKLHETYADFLAHTPIVNIDASPANEHFGHINIVDITASAVSEVCFTLFNAIDQQLVDNETATCLLAGIIANTKSFRTHNVSQKTLEVASALIERGARRDEVVERLYRTRSVETLRLWGRALARLKSDDHLQLAWTSLTREDFIAAGTGHEALNDIVSELLSTSPSARVVGILYERDDQSIGVHLFADRPYNASDLASPFAPTGGREIAHFIMRDSTIISAEQQVIAHLRSALAQTNDRS